MKLLISVLLSFVVIVYVTCSDSGNSTGRILCSEEFTDDGKWITCGDTTFFISDNNFSIIDPCGNIENEYDEIILKYSNNILIAYFKDGENEFLSLLEPGEYITTDFQQCRFTVSDDYEITW